MNKRHSHSPEFKGSVTVEAISGRMTIEEIVADHAIHSIQLGRWERPLLNSASDLFTRSKKRTDKSESKPKEPEIFRQIGKFQMELGGSKKDVNFSDVDELRRLVEHDHPEPSVNL